MRSKFGWLEFGWFLFQAWARRALNLTEETDFLKSAGLGQLRFVPSAEQIVIKPNEVEGRLQESSEGSTASNQCSVPDTAAVHPHRLPIEDTSGE